jgi:hypothetical protein
METYRIKSLGEIIEFLRGTPASAYVVGFADDGEIYSDRGYYERNATAPSSVGIHRTHVLADLFESQIGKEIYGYKGGDYFVRSDMPVAYAAWGDTGPYIAGFQVNPDGNYEPVVIDESFWF